MADTYYRSLYFSLHSPEDLEVLGMLLAVPRRRRADAIRRALQQYLPTILDGPPLGPDEVRTAVRNAQGRSRRRAPRRPSGSGAPSAPFEQALAHEAPEPAAEVLSAKQAPDVQTAARLLETKLDQLMKSRWIG